MSFTNAAENSDAAEIVASVIDGTEAAYAERRRKQESDVVQLLAMVM
jgi:hypothetical protein